jgi:hypothetical protein
VGEFGGGSWRVYARGTERRREELETGRWSPEGRESRRVGRRMLIGGALSMVGMCEAIADEYSRPAKPCALSSYNEEKGFMAGPIMNHDSRSFLLQTTGSWKSMMNVHARGRAQCTARSGRRKCLGAPRHYKFPMRLPSQSPRHCLLAFFFLLL